MGFPVQFLCTECLRPTLHSILFHSISIQFPLIVHWICLHRMFETHPPWRNLWQHKGSRLPIEDQMVLPRWLHSSIHYISRRFCSCWSCSFQVCSAHSDQLDLPGQGARLIVRLLFGFSDSVKPKKNVSSSNYYLNFYWFCQTQPKYQEILDLTRWLGRWTIRRRWLQAFNGLPSMNFILWKSLSKY